MEAQQNRKVFVEGRYRKLTRDLPQTVFFCPTCKGHPRRRKKCTKCEGFGKLTRDSVQELIGWVLGAEFKTRKSKFHGAGREDVDVRMLGSGRPFVMEFINPKVHSIDLAAMEAEINRRNAGRLELLGLHWTEKARVRVLKETHHAKEYEAVVDVEGEVTVAAFAKALGERRTVEQDTPERVAYRRAAKTRERWVEYLTAAPVEGTVAEETPPGCSAFLVRVRCEHGTYVKEAISGEGGATRPSLADLIGQPCKCRTLDVLAILDDAGTEPVEVPTVEQPAGFGDGV
ncbi:MAG: tRNA pseudouridine(54/55) synthase Pus10 [Planctomycetota bacterium]|nr:tRNA pseudouridine(54/55) synthase Pus10 [Planctomycetota bacterium]MDP6955576.1 tRNA pseudouridine(54/55) synthase Pus10 [Planctomycetota bacterium]